jgi:hypothetical protein
MDRVAVMRVVRHVTLEERDPMTTLGERAAQSTPDCGVTVAP